MAFIDGVLTKIVEDAIEVRDIDNTVKGVCFTIKEDERRNGYIVYYGRFRLNGRLFEFEGEVDKSEPDDPILDRVIIKKMSEVIASKLLSER